jgi:BirA family transcriptional regulator, biotin operon repressor / biotin---[acetyl-CoA-carboxylase] ligase
MMTGSTVLSMYDDIPCDVLQRRSGSPQLVVVDRCASTMDLAHTLAADGAPHGTSVVAEEQGAGRGRTGKAWVSTRGAGVWVSVLLRRSAATPAGVLSLRTGLELAHALDGLSATTIQLKWPNDLFVGGRKLAGILTEARWRGDQLEWIVVGVGINVSATAADTSVATLSPGARRGEVLISAIECVLGAAGHSGDLSADELARFAARDLAIGRDVESPLAGTVVGITARGGVRIRTATGDAIAVAGSLVFRSSPAE